MFTLFLLAAASGNVVLGCGGQGNDEGKACQGGIRPGKELSSEQSADTLPLEVQQAFLRIIQEALANVHRHASATHVAVDLRCLSNRVHLVVIDDGHGFPDERDARGRRETLVTGVGLAGMTARARQLGGVLDVRSGRRRTAIHVVVPVQASDIRCES